MVIHALAQSMRLFLLFKNYCLHHMSSFLHRVWWLWVMLGRKKEFDLSPAPTNTSSFLSFLFIFYVRRNGVKHDGRLSAKLSLD